MFEQRADMLHCIHNICRGVATEQHVYGSGPILIVNISMSAVNRLHCLDDGILLHAAREKYYRKPVLVQALYIVGLS